MQDSAGTPTGTRDAGPGVGRSKDARDAAGTRPGRGYWDAAETGRSLAGTPAGPPGRRRPERETEAGRETQVELC